MKYFYLLKVKLWYSPGIKTNLVKEKEEEDLQDRKWW